MIGNDTHGGRENQRDGKRAAAPPPPLRVRLLGDVLVELDGERLTGFDAPRLQRLLAALVLAGDTPLSRARLAYDLWPDSTDAQARTNLRHLLHDLRRALPACERYVEITNQTLRWRPDAGADVDVISFGQALERDDTAAAGVHYGGDLLPACYDDWTLAERDRLRALALEALTRAASEAAAAGDDETAISHARHLLRVDPLHEPVCALLIAAHARRGERAEAVRRYHACAEALDRDLGVEPGPDLHAAYEAARGAPDPGEDQAPTFPSPASTASVPFVGRDEPWAEATAAWRAAGGGRAGLLLVCGEPGIGKSRLVSELARHAVGDGAAVATTRAYAAAGSPAWGPVVDWLRSPAIAASVRALDPVWRTELARLLPELRIEDPRLLPPGPGADRAQRHHLLDALARALTGEQPRLLVIDDLQWCDPDTIELLGFVLRQAPGAPLLMAGSARLEEAGDGHPLAALRAALARSGQVTEIVLEPLDVAATAMLAGRLSGARLDGATAERLHRETAGNPLFVIEAVRAGFVAGAEDAVLTPTVRSVIMERLAQVSPVGRRLLEVAATIGRSFDLTVLAAASAAPEDDVVDALDELWRRRIVREHGTAYDFSHDRIRDVATETISPARRRRLHRAVADALVAIHGDDLGPVSARVGAHLEQAGLVAEAVDAYRRAADQAITVFALDDAITSLRRALLLLEQLPGGPGRDKAELELRTALGVPFAAREGYGSASAYDAYERALALSRRLGRPASPPVLRGLGLAAVMGCRFGRARALGLELLEHADDPIAVTEGEYVLGVSAFWRGDIHGARRHLAAAVAAYQPALGPVHRAWYAQDPKAVCLVRLACALWWAGEADEAWRVADEALAYADSLGHPLSTGYVLMFSGILACESDERGRLAEVLDRGRLLWAEHSLEYFIALGRLLEAWQSVRDGDGHAVGRVQEVVAGWRSSRQSLHLSYALALLARCHERAGEHDPARRAVSEALRWTADHDQHYLDAELLRFDGELLCRLGDREGAANRFRRAQAVAAAQGAAFYERRAAASLELLIAGVSSRNA